MPTLLEVFEFLLQETKFSYLGQCDKLRRNSPEREGYWQEMMAKAKPLPVKKFIQVADMAAIMDEDDEALEYISQLKSSDPTTNTYQSTWNGRPCVFLQTGGFEFIFVQ